MKTEQTAIKFKVGDKVRFSFSATCGMYRVESITRCAALVVLTCSDDKMPAFRFNIPQDGVELITQESK